jgi:hypothetical protein
MHSLELSKDGMLLVRLLCDKFARINPLTRRRLYQIHPRRQAFQINELSGGDYLMAHQPTLRVKQADFDGVGDGFGKRNWFFDKSRGIENAQRFF